MLKSMKINFKTKNLYVLTIPTIPAFPSATFRREKTKQKKISRDSPSILECQKLIFFLKKNQNCSFRISQRVVIGTTIEWKKEKTQRFTFSVPVVFDHPIHRILKTPSGFRRAQGRDNLRRQ
jgi:hypothetical protein